MAWLLTLCCDGCSMPLETDAEDRKIGRWMGPDYGKRGIRGTACDLIEEALTRGWLQQNPGRKARYYCPTCRLARERRSLVPDAAPEHMTRATN